MDKDSRFAADIHKHFPNQIVTKLHPNLTGAMNNMVPHLSILGVLQLRHKIPSANKGMVSR